MHLFVAGMSLSELLHFERSPYPPIVTQSTPEGEVDAYAVSIGLTIDPNTITVGGIHMGWDRRSGLSRGFPTILNHLRERYPGTVPLGASKERAIPVEGKPAGSILAYILVLKGFV